MSSTLNNNLNNICNNLYNNPFEQINQNNNLDSNYINIFTKDENISDSEENKKLITNDAVNRKNTNENISEITYTKNNTKENFDESSFQNNNPTFIPETVDKQRESINIEILSNIRDSVGSNKSKDSSLAKHPINKSPDLNTKLKINNDPPYLPSKSLMRTPRSYTLVLDLDETLVHFVEENDSAYIQIRPGAEHFLEEMSKYYEVVVFTAAMQDVIFLIYFLIFDYLFYIFI